jgi:hypothetical protein
MSQKRQHQDCIPAACKKQVAWAVSAEQLEAHKTADNCPCANTEPILIYSVI